MPVTTPNQPVAWRPDVIAFTPDDVVGEALLLRTTTVVGTVEGDQPSVRVPFVADDGDVAFVAEGEQIGAADQQFSEAIVATRKLGTVGQYSRESLEQPNAAAMIVQSLNRAIVNKADRALLSNAADPTGLLNAPDIVDGGALGADLDALTDAVSRIEYAGGAASALIASPGAWATLSKLKAGTDSNSTLLGSGTEAVERRVLGVPVLTSASMPDGQLLLVDRSAIIAAAGEVKLARSEEAFFTSDVVAIRVTWRFGWSVMRPGRIVRLSTTAPAG